jgi:hypothetical protein
MYCKNAVQQGNKMQTVQHETFLMLAQAAWDAADEEARNEFLNALFEGDFEDGCTLEQAVEYFEDTRTEEDVNTMLAAFTKLGIARWRYREDEEIYTLV